MKTGTALYKLQSDIIYSSRRHIHAFKYTRLSSIHTQTHTESDMFCIILLYEELREIFLVAVFLLFSTHFLLLFLLLVLFLMIHSIFIKKFLNQVAKYSYMYLVKYKHVLYFTIWFFFRSFWFLTAICFTPFFFFVVRQKKIH